MRATMVAADDRGRHGSHCLSHHHWRLKGLLPSPALSPARKDSGLRGTQKPVARHANAVADAVAPARCTVMGTAASCGRMTKTKTEVETMMMMTWMAQTTPVPVTAHRRKRRHSQLTCTAPDHASSMTSLELWGSSSASLYYASLTMRRTRKDCRRRNYGRDWGSSSCCWCWKIHSFSTGLRENCIVPHKAEP